MKICLGKKTCNFQQCILWDLHQVIKFSTSPYISTSPYMSEFFTLDHTGLDGPAIFTLNKHLISQGAATRVLLASLWFQHGHSMNSVN